MCFWFRLKLSQDYFRSVHNRIGEASEATDLNAITAVRSSGYQFV